MKKKTGKASIFLMIIFLAAVIAAVAYLIIDTNKDPYEGMGVTWYPIANQNIEWTYAGKGGAGK